MTEVAIVGWYLVGGLLYNIWALYNFVERFETMPRPHHLLLTVVLWPIPVTVGVIRAVIAVVMLLKSVLQAKDSDV